MIFLKNHSERTKCVFSADNKFHNGEKPVAYMIGHHEFTNHPDKPLCRLHYDRLYAFMTRKVKRGR